MAFTFSEEQEQRACMAVYRDSVHASFGYHWPGDTPRAQPNKFMAAEGIHETRPLDPDDPEDCAIMNNVVSLVHRVAFALSTPPTDTPIEGD